MISQFCFCIAACDTLTQNMSCERFFHHFNSFKNDRNSQIALFENFLTNENFSFSLIFCTRNRHLTVIEDYIERDDVIRCELNRLAFIEIWFCLFIDESMKRDHVLITSLNSWILELWIRSYSRSFVPH